jgi:hypothetical protein
VALRKRILRVVLVLVVALVVAVAAYAPRMARIGVGYAAEQTCACLFVSGRTLESCRGDLDGLARRFVRLEPGQDEVRASSLGSHATARHRAGFGCSLVD